MIASIRSLLDPELKIREMPAKWWREEVLLLIIINAGILMAVFRHVLPAWDCHKIGLGHGQCIKAGSRSPISAVVNVIGKRRAVMNGYEVYTRSWCPKLARLCAIRGVKKIYYADGGPGTDEIRALKAVRAEAIRVRV